MVPLAQKITVDKPKRSKGKPRHTKSEFYDEPLGVPTHIEANGFGLWICADDEEGRGHTVIRLHPRHILAIQSMYTDWWESHWAAVHEEEA